MFENNLRKQTKSGQASTAKECHFPQIIEHFIPIIPLWIIISFASVLLDQVHHKYTYGLIIRHQFIIIRHLSSIIRHKSIIIKHHFILIRDKFCYKAPIYY